MTEPEREKALDRCKASLFMHSNAAFYGSLLCALQVVWNADIPTACVDGTTIEWNPDWFDELSPDARKTVLMHEVNHVARLHLLRAAGKDSSIWNYACDFRINNDLHAERYSFDGIEDACRDPSYDHDHIASEEEIYEQLMKSAVPNQPVPLSGDMVDMGKSAQAQQVVNAVAQAVQAAQSVGGNVPGTVKEYLNRFTNPTVPWEAVLWDFFTSLKDPEINWSRPNRRFQDIYLPSSQDSNNGLQHLMYFLDTSGSVSTEEIVRFNSEVRYIVEVLQPELLTLVQFDTQIQHVSVYEQGDLFEGLDVVGRGGTSLSCVSAYIRERQPTAAIIFSDLECSPMADPEIPVIWVKSGVHGHTPKYGQVISVN